MSGGCTEYSVVDDDRAITNSLLISLSSLCFPVSYCFASGSGVYPVGDIHTGTGFSLRRDAVNPRTPYKLDVRTSISLISGLDPEETSRRGWIVVYIDLVYSERGMLIVIGCHWVGVMQELVLLLAYPSLSRVNIYSRCR